jgi:hypothetical protein
VKDRVLPPDAVDLIVEDEAAAERMTRERGSAPGPPLKKVYKRGYAVKGEDGGGSKRGEFEIERDPPPVDLKTVRDRESEELGVVTQGGEDRLVIPETQGEVVVETDAPSHIRDVFGPSDDDHNPWA